MKIKSAAGHKLAFYNPAGSHGGAPTSTSVYCATHHEYYGNLIIYNSTLHYFARKSFIPRPLCDEDSIQCAECMSEMFD